MKLQYIFRAYGKLGVFGYLPQEIISTSLEIMILSVLEQLVSGTWHEDYVFLEDDVPATIYVSATISYLMLVRCSSTIILRIVSKAGITDKIVNGHI